MNIYLLDPQWDQYHIMTQLTTQEYINVIDYINFTINTINQQPH